MKKSPFTRFMAFSLAALMMASSSIPSEASSYVIGPGDELFVDFPLRGTPSDLQSLGGNGMTLVIVGESVFFRYTAVVAPDGFITLPSMEPLRVDGWTLEQTRDEITKRLKNKTLDVRQDISVILSRSNSSAFIVSGEVNHAGRFLYDRPTSLLEAIAMAGGPTDHAQLKRVMLLRHGQAPLSVDVSDQHLAEAGSPTIPLMPADSVIVPRRWFTPDSVMLLLILSSITTAATVYVASRY